MRISDCGPQDPEIPFFPGLLIYLIFLVLISNCSPRKNIYTSCRDVLSVTVEINQKKLYYNYYTSGKFLTLKVKFR